MEIARRAAEFESFSTASHSLLQVVEYFPRRIDLLELAGQYAVQGGDAEDGIRLLQKVAQSRNLSLESHIALGDAANKQSDLNLAIQAWTTSLLAGAEPIVIYPRLAKAHRTLGDIDAAILDLNKLIEFQPANATLYYQLGLLFASKDPEKAITYFTRAIELDPSLEPVIQPFRRNLRTARLADNEAYLLLISGRELASLEEWDLAEDAFHQATLIAPDYAEAWAFLAEARQHLPATETSDEQILENLEKGLAQDPDSVVANTLMALYWKRQDKYDLAIERLYHAIGEDPDNPTLHIELGNTLAQLGEVSSAQKSFQTAVELAPRDAIYWRALASFSLNYELEVREIGLPAARQAVLLDADNPASLDIMGQIFTLLNDPISAERFLHRALRKDPGYAPARLHLGFLYMIQGDTSEAQEQLTLAKSLAPPGNPTSLQAARLLQRYFP